MKLGWTSRDKGDLTSRSSATMIGHMSSAGAGSRVGGNSLYRGGGDALAKIRKWETGRWKGRCGYERRIILLSHTHTLLKLFRQLLSSVSSLDPRRLWSHLLSCAFCWAVYMCSQALYDWVNCFDLKLIVCFGHRVRVLSHLFGCMSPSFSNVLLPMHGPRALRVFSFLSSLLPSLHL